MLWLDVQLFLSKLAFAGYLILVYVISVMSTILAPLR